MNASGSEGSWADYLTGLVAGARDGAYDYTRAILGVVEGAGTAAGSRVAVAVDRASAAMPYMGKALADFELDGVTPKAMLDMGSDEREALLFALVDRLIVTPGEAEEPFFDKLKEALGEGFFTLYDDLVALADKGDEEALEDQKALCLRLCGDEGGDQELRKIITIIFALLRYRVFKAGG